MKLRGHGKGRLPTQVVPGDRRARKGRFCAIHHLLIWISLVAI